MTFWAMLFHMKPKKISRTGFQRDGEQRIDKESRKIECEDSKETKALKTSSVLKRGNPRRELFPKSLVRWSINMRSLRCPATQVMIGHCSIPPGFFGESSAVSVQVAPFERTLYLAASRLSSRVTTKRSWT